MKFPNLVLADYRVVSLQCERYAPPIGAKPGKLHLSGGTTVVWPDSSAKRATREVVITINLEAIGKAGDKKLGKNGNYFLIKIVAEGCFTVPAKLELTKEDQSSDLVIELTKQVHPLAVMTVRSCAEQMGFLGVRPDLGFAYAHIKVDEEEVEA